MARTPIETLRRDALYQAERDLVNAALNAEHWAMLEAMLGGRVQRLRDELKAAEQ